MTFELLAIVVAVGFFTCMLVLIEVGRRVGLSQASLYGSEARIGIGVVDGAVYGIFALLIGFTFSGAATRFDQRRAIISREVNAISTAWLRLDLLPPEAQGALRDGFRIYLIRFSSRTRIRAIRPRGCSRLRRSRGPNGPSGRMRSRRPPRLAVSAPAYCSCHR